MTLTPGRFLKGKKIQSKAIKLCLVLFTILINKLDSLYLQPSLIIVGEVRS